MGGLRVIAGTAKGHKLHSVPGDSTRPITDRTKESLFNILGVDIQGATFLDLFAGTGGVGIEALSRGAVFARFLDKNQNAIQTIRSNLQSTRTSDRAEVVRMDVFNLLRGKPDRSFDYIYIAPPQYKGLWRRALIELDNNQGWLSPDAWVIVQIHPKEYWTTELKNLIEFDQRRYGSTLLLFYEQQRLRDSTSDEYPVNEV
jgi:16S rRNA (guanine(966)-N(2))-methyltransferase RsmD